MEHQAVVRIFATTQSPDYQSPWQSQAPTSGTGSGVVIAPGKVLTGAHVVADATFLQVQKVSDPNKQVARVEAIDHDCDLALLTVDEPSFMDAVVPEELGDLPSLRDRVSVVGYPIGGEEISVTEGVVSRIEVQRYSHSERMVLAATVDAAINDGNSGGPVFKDGKIAGIAFQSYQDAENIGEMVPTPIIRKFLERVGREHAPQVPGLGITVQNLENPLLHQRAGLAKDQSGMLVMSVEYDGSAWGKVKAGDALLSIDGHPIANNGTVRYRDRLRTTFDVMLGEHHIGDKLALSVLRDGTVLDISIELKPFRTMVPRSQYDTTPIYFIYGGLVFQPLSLDLLRTWQTWWEKAPPEFLHAYYTGVRTEKQHEIVVITQVLADEINQGYEGLDNTAIQTVNSVVPRNMRHFVELVEAAGEATEIRTADHCMAVFEPTAARLAGKRICARYDVRHDRSKELRAKPSA